MLDGCGTPPKAKTLLYVLGVALHQETSRTKQELALDDVEEENTALFSHFPALGLSVDNKLFTTTTTEHTMRSGGKRLSTVTRISHKLTVPPGLLEDGWQEPQPKSMRFDQVVERIFMLSDVERTAMHNFYELHIADLIASHTAQLTKVW